MLGKVEICGVNTAKLKVLKDDEMMELMARSKQGDQEARNALVEGNLRLVLSVIQRFSGSGESPDDLFQVGCIGLIKAITNFSMEYNVNFSTYGVPMIAGEVRRFLRDNSAIRVSRSLRDTAYRVLQAREAMMKEQQKEPTMEEIAKNLGLPVEEVNFAMDAIASPMSLYDPIYSDGGDPLTVMDQVRDTKNTDEMWIEHIALREAISELGDREKRILALRFYDGRTSARPRSPGWRKTPLNRSAKPLWCSKEENGHRLYRMEGSYDGEDDGASLPGGHQYLRRLPAGLCDRFGIGLYRGQCGGADRAGKGAAVRPAWAGGRVCDPLELHPPHRRGYHSGGGGAGTHPQALPEKEAVAVN